MYLSGCGLCQCACARPTHYDVIAPRDCHTAARKHYTTARRSREKARDTDAALLYVHPHVTDLLLPAPSTGCGCPARFMLHMLISASLRQRDDRHYWWSQRVICLCRAYYSATLACPLQSANAFSLWVLSRQVWMQLQLEHRFWKNVTGARFWKWVPDNWILLNLSLRSKKVTLTSTSPVQWVDHTGKNQLWITLLLQGMAMSM